VRVERLATVCLLALVLCGCGAADELLNSCPRVTGVRVVGWDGAELRVGVWVQDLEEDPVDLVVTDGTGKEVTDVLGHGAVGLSSGAELPGAAHELWIEGQYVKGGKMGFRPVDVEGCEGETVWLGVPAVGGGR